MVRLFVRMNVADYETWRKVYDQFYGERVDMGVMGAAAFQLPVRVRLARPQDTGAPRCLGWE